MTKKQIEAICAELNTIQAWDISHDGRDVRCAAHYNEKTRQIMRRLADENNAELEYSRRHPRQHDFIYSFLSRPVRKGMGRPILSTVSFMERCLPGHSHRDDVAEMEDLFKAYDDAEDDFGPDDVRTKNARKAAEDYEDGLLLEALLAAINSGRLLWGGES
jgi:hypothetical protein